MKHALAYNFPNPLVSYGMTLKDLCNGPSKLCMSLAISRIEFDQKDLTSADSLLFVEDDGFRIDESDVAQRARIGMGKSAEEWKDKPLRFFVSGNSFVSKQ